MLEHNITLRPATQSDWRSIASLLEENGLPLDGARQHLVNFLVAMAGDVVVGCAGAEVYGDVALLRSVAVAPLMRSNGVGTRLVTRLLQDAEQRKIGKWYLLTTGAQEYFARIGFAAEPIEKAPICLQASAEFQGACPATAVFMSLALAPRSK
jgi:N-acetylglutamate synthase-like GNAT family acetyltransferase